MRQGGALYDLLLLRMCIESLPWQWLMGGEPCDTLMS